MLKKVFVVLIILKSAEPQLFSSKAAEVETNAPTRTKKTIAEGDLLEAKLSLITRISTQQISNKEKYKIYEICEAFEESISKEDIKFLVDNYFRTGNRKVKWQIRTLLEELRGPHIREWYRDVHKDPRVKEEPDKEIFFSTIAPLLLEDEKEDIKGILRFLAENEVSDTTYPPIWFEKLQTTNQKDLFYQIFDLQTENSKSLLNFMLALSVIVNTETPENEARISQILKALEGPKDTEVALGIYNALQWVYIDMNNLNKVINEGGFTNKTTKIDSEWQKRFKAQLLDWEKNLSDPKRIKERKRRTTITETEREVSLAKSFYLSKNDSESKYNQEAKFEDISDDLNLIRAKNGKNKIVSITELEEETGTKILTLGTYDNKEFEGEGIDWGQALDGNSKDLLTDPK